MRFSTTTRLVTQRLLAWPAALMLLIQPLSLANQDCQCLDSSPTAEQTQIATCCSDTQPRPSCCSPKKTTCCSLQSSQPNNVCDCGDQCRCSVQNEPTLPSPVVPVNQAEHEQIQLILLTLEAPVRRLTFDADDQKTDSSPASGRSLSSLQTCVLLSRFTC